MPWPILDYLLTFATLTGALTFLAFRFWPKRGANAPCSGCPKCGKLKALMAGNRSSL